MTLKNYLFVMSVLTAICWVIFFFVADIINPFSTNWLGFLLFYASLFIALVGLCTLVGFLIRFVILKKGLAFNLVKLSFRQSFLFALFLVLSLFLQANNLLTWLNLIFLIMTFSVLEIFLLSNKKKR
ncbi:MAG: hypothetical protein PHX76_00585 [Patescibacteria group bacterium]|nr:hypothetical protein [Patescibacteria group bacterium]NCU39491.1 hypothetical protein [Candidatus Falkowbacteria bacterium]